MDTGVQILKKLKGKKFNEKKLVVILERCCILHPNCKNVEKCKMLYDEVCDKLPATGARYGSL
jgi:hypothetical protein